MITSQQYTQFCKIVAANCVDQAGSVRFSYKQLKLALVAEDSEIDSVFDKCLAFAAISPTELNSTLTRKTLKLAFINIQMTYKLITRELVTLDESVMDLKTLFIEQLD